MYDTGYSAARSTVEAAERKASWRGYRDWSGDIPRLYQVRDLVLTPWLPEREWVLWEDGDGWHAEPGDVAEFTDSAGTIPGDIELFGARYRLVQCIAPMVSDAMRPLATPPELAALGDALFGKND